MFQNGLMNYLNYKVIIMNGLLNLIVNMLYNLNLFWDIEKQYHHKNNKLKANNKSIYYFGPMTKK